MQIQPASAYRAFSFAQTPARQQPASAAPTANSADRATISQAAWELFAAHAKPAPSSGSSATDMIDTSNGPVSIDDYFAPPGSQGVDMDFAPLLLPNPKTIDTLTRHIAANFPGFLAENNIPSPPSSITYDNEGKMQLPADYPYAAEFKQALADNPQMDRELRTVNALTSHLVEMKKSIPFNEEYAAAPSQAAADAVVAKYSYLFSNNRHYDAIALNFSANGELSLTHDGKPLSQA
jgi:hypothetical protein